MRILILCGHPDVHLGGSEIQSDVLATSWTELGHEVVFGALDAGYEVCATIGRDYRIEAIPERSLQRLLMLMLEFEPDVVYWRAGRYRLWRAVAAARLSAAAFVFAIAHRSHVRKWTYTAGGVEGGPTRQLKYAMLKSRQLILSRLNFAAYRGVDGITSNVSNLLDEFPHGLGLPEFRTTIYNAIWPDFELPFTWPRPYAVWVANLKQAKHPEAYVEAAARLQSRVSELDFLMVGSIHQEEFRYIEDPARVPSNFHFLGRRSPEEVNAILANALMLVHTCEPEGFCGNFIQAWWQGTPTITLSYDPDGIIEEHEAGRCSGTLDTMVEDIAEFATDSDLRIRAGRNALGLARRCFEPVRNARRHLEFFESLLDG